MQIVKALTPGESVEESATEGDREEGKVFRLSTEFML